jgi:hypothetical protein
MRPAVLEDGHRLRARIFIRLVRALSRQRIDPVVQMAMYRPQFFGDPFFILGPEVLRGPSYWTPAERKIPRSVHLATERVPVLCADAHRDDSGGVRRHD